jgi:hypothetical protein
MVELATLQAVSYIMGSLGVFVAAVYYIMNIKNNQRNQEIAHRNQELGLKAQELQLETRQAQLFMQLYSIYDSKDFINDYTDVCWRHEYSDLDDWMKKYHPQKNPEAYASFMRLGRFYEGVGILVEKNLISLDLVVELMSEAIIFSWDRLKVYAYGQRELTNMPIWEHFENLMTEVKARQPKAISADSLLKKTKEISEKL